MTGDELSTSPPDIEVIGLAELYWLVEEAGPTFLKNNPALVERSQSRSASLDRDESGSGHGFRFLLAKARTGISPEEAIAQLLDDAGTAGEWARRSDERQHERAWARASQIAEDETTDIAAAFEGENDTTECADPITERLNTKHAVVVVNGRSLVATLKDDGAIEFGATKDLDTLYANVLVPGPDGKLQTAARHWLKSPQRRTYRNGLSFCFGRPPAATLNLWTGWAVDPDEDSSCELFLRHTKEIICAGDEALYRYLIGWLAHMVQHPQEKPGVAVVVRGAKGAGKDTFADYISALMPRRHAPTVAQMSHVVGRFNGRLEAALFLNIQEGFWAGSRDAESVLKYLITSDYIEVERKGLDSYGVPSFLRIFVSANADWVVPATSDERRFAIFEASDEKRGDGSYFQALRAEMADGGPAALLQHLQSQDLSGFDVRRPPASAALRDQKLHSLRGFDRWWFSALCEGSVADLKDWDAKPLRISCENLRQNYERWIRERRYEGDPINPKQFGEKLHGWVDHLIRSRPRRHGERVWEYELPILSDCRDSFARKLDVHIDWDR